MIVWLFLATVVVCLTIIALARMYLELRRQDQQHVRLTQADQRNHERYVAVTRQEALADLKQAVEQATNRALPKPTYRKDRSKFTAEEIEEYRYNMKVLYEGELIDRRTLTADQLIAIKQQVDYDAFNDSQRRMADYDVPQRLDYRGHPFL